MDAPVKPKHPTKPKQADPTPEEIQQACLEIQATWSPDERLRRLRADWRPTHTLADRSRRELDPDVYNEHIENQREFDSTDEDWRKPKEVTRWLD